MLVVRIAEVCVVALIGAVIGLWLRGGDNTRALTIIGVIGGAIFVAACLLGGHP